MRSSRRQLQENNVRTSCAHLSHRTVEVDHADPVAIELELQAVHLGERDIVSNIENIEGFKIGIAWQGEPSYESDRQRSIPLAEFEPLARLPGVRLISLQKGRGVEQIPGLAERFSVEHTFIDIPNPV